MRFRVVSAAALLAAVPGYSLALGLGDETVRSYLNAPLNAEIELIATSEELATLRVQLAPRDEFIRHGLDYPSFLTGIELRAERLADGRNVIRLTTSQALIEPFLVVLIDVRTSSSRLTREYTLLLDPPTFQSSTAPAPPVAAPVAGDQPGTTVRPAPAPAPTPPPATPSSPPPAVVAAPPVQSAPAGGGGQYTVQRGDTLSAIVDREYGSAERSRALIAVFRANPGAFAGNINQLRAGASLSLPAQDVLAGIDRAEALAEVRSQMSAWQSSITPSGESQAARLRLVPPATTEAPEASPGPGSRPGASQPATTGPDRPVAVESPNLARIQESQTPAAPATPPASPPASTETPATPTAEGEASEPAATEAQEPAPAQAVAPAPAATPAPAGKSDGGILALVKQYWMYAAGAVGVLALVAFVATRRRRSATSAFVPAVPSLDDLVLPGERDSSADTFPMRRPTDGRDSNILVEETGIHERTATRKETRTVDLEEGGTSATMGTMALEQGDPLAEADFHMAYGLYDQAADLVKAALKREPDRRDLKLKLLEVYFVWGNKEQFLQTARELSKTRDTTAPGEWEKVVIMGKQLAPEDVLFHHSAMGAQTSVDLNLEGGQNLVDFNLPDAGGGPEMGGVDVNLSSTDTGLKTINADGGLDFMFEDPARAEDGAPTATTRQMAQPGLDAINAPTIEQPALDIENTLAGKLDAHATFMGSPDQTAELALDDLGLDLGKLEATGTGIAPPLESEAAGDAPTMVAGLDETSRELLASADASQRTEMLPLTDLDLSGTGTGLDMEFGSGDTGKAHTLDAGSGLDLDVGAAEQADNGQWQSTQRIDPTILDGEAPKELEPVTMSEVGTKLDLARAYMDMGDPDGARNILSEVLQEGSESQRQEAQRLLDSIPG
jgi:pilus assembly protein FimV